MPRRIPDFPDAYASLNTLCSFGSIITLISTIIFVLAVIFKWRGIRTGLLLLEMAVIVARPLAKNLLIKFQALVKRSTSFMAASPLLILFTTEDCLELTVTGKMAVAIAALPFAIAITFIIDRFMYYFLRVRDKYYNIRRAKARARRRRIKFARKLSAIYARYFAIRKIKGVILSPLIFALFIRGFFKSPESKKYVYFILLQSSLGWLLVLAELIALQSWLIVLVVIGAQLIRIDQLGFLANNLVAEGVALTTPLLITHLRHNIASMKTSKNIIVRYVGTRVAAGIFFGETGLTLTGRAMLLGAAVGMVGVVIDSYYQQQHELRMHKDIMGERAER